MNAARGEAVLACREGRFVLCLTLGALAEIEAALGSVDAGRIARLTAGDLVAILRALLRGGGEYRAAREVERLTLEPKVAAEAIAACFAGAVR